MRRRAQLVCQHLENISREALEKHQEIIRTYVRGRQGIYALYRRGKLYYVGLATNLRNRLKIHLKDRHGQSWDRFSVYLTIGDNHLRELEALILPHGATFWQQTEGQVREVRGSPPPVQARIKRCVLAEVDGLFSESRPVRAPREAIPEHRPESRAGKIHFRPPQAEGAVQGSDRQSESAARRQGLVCRHNIHVALSSSSSGLPAEVLRWLAFLAYVSEPPAIGCCSTPCDAEDSTPTQFLENSNANHSRHCSAVQAAFSSMMGLALGRLRRFSTVNRGGSGIVWAVSQ